MATAIVFLLLLTACSTPTSTPTPAPAPGTTSIAVSTSTSAASGTLSVSSLSVSGQPTMTVTPATSLYDQSLTVDVSGLPPGAGVTVTARATDVSGAAWKASADFTATADGRVSLSQPAGSGGYYTGVNPMGLFENMTSATTSAMVFIPKDRNGYSVDLDASVGGAVVASAVVHRLNTQSVGVHETTETLGSTGIYGALYMPGTVAPHKPALVIFGGSEGGLGTAYVASQLAGHGYPTLALAYFHEPGLPATLSNIPLEYFVRALHLLGSQPGVDRNKIITFGVSRGSEAALLLGADFPTLVHGVVAGSPSAVVFSSPASSAAWTLQGKAIPYATALDYNSGDPHPADAPNSVIPVEQIKGPIFTVCGELDALWHSCGYSAAITARLTAHHVSYPRTALEYPDAGHLVGGLDIFLNTTTTDSWGGTVNSNAMGAADGYGKLLTWLAAQ